MKGELKYKILNFIEDRALGGVDFVGAFLSAGYGATLSKMEYESDKRARRRENYKWERERRQRLQKYLFKLKSEGLIDESKNGILVLRPKGKKAVKNFQDKIHPNYEREDSDKLIIVSYDIPEEFKKERDLLRGILKRLGLRMIHKSVLVGKVKIPRQLVLDLGKINILQFIEIMEVTKSGSLKSLG